MKIVVEFEVANWDNYDVPLGDTEVLLDLLGELLTPEEIDTVQISVDGKQV